MSDIKRYEDLVYDLLVRFEDMRDDVNKLYVACIRYIRGLDYVRNTTLSEFFGEVNKDLPKVPTMASVIRLNTKLQKKYPNLRGKDWEKKQKHSKDYKKDLGYKVV